MADREPVPTLVVNEIWARSGGCCECENEAHGHEGKCGQRGIMPMQGGPNVGGWEAIVIDPEGPMTAENTMIVCSGCFAKMREAGEL